MSACDYSVLLLLEELGDKINICRGIARFTRLNFMFRDKYFNVYILSIYCMC